jgi:hypothetical protein
MNKVIDMEEVMEAVYQDDNLGVCLACGAWHDGVEPDARRYRCEECGEARVYSAVEIILWRMA